MFQLPPLNFIVLAIFFGGGVGTYFTVLFFCLTFIDDIFLIKYIYLFIFKSLTYDINILYFIYKI